MPAKALCWLYWLQVVKKLGEAVKAMQGDLPVLQALRNSALKERHWTKLAAVMGTPLVTDPPLSLAQVLDLKVGHYPLQPMLLKSSTPKSSMSSGVVHERMCLF